MQDTVLAIARRRWQMESRLCRDWVKKHRPKLFEAISKLAQKYAVNGSRPDPKEAPRD